MNTIAMDLCGGQASSIRHYCDKDEKQNRELGMRLAALLTFIVIVMHRADGQMCWREETTRGICNVSIKLPGYILSQDGKPAVGGGAGGDWIGSCAALTLVEQRVMAQQEPANTRGVVGGRTGDIQVLASHRLPRVVGQHSC